MFELEELKAQIAALTSSIQCILNGDCCEGATVVIPNDLWVTILNNGVGITNPQGTAGGTTYNSVVVDVAYKILSEDTAVIKVRGVLNVNIATVEGFNAIDNLLNFSFVLDNIQIGNSQWFPLQEKKFQGLFPDLLGNNFGVPVVITHTGGDALLVSNYDSSGRAGCSNGSVFCQNVSPKVLAGNYIFSVEFEMVVQL